MTQRVIKFRLRQDNAIVGYEKWYPGQREGGKEYGDFKAFPELLYSVDGENWFPARTNPIRTWWNNKDESTGLHDKNGKEIWEGDVCEFDKYEWYRSPVRTRQDIDKEPPHRFVINWDDHESKWGYDGGTSDLGIYVEVIGNIYENPDLLK